MRRMILWVFFAVCAVCGFFFAASLLVVLAFLFEGQSLQGGAGWYRVFLVLEWLGVSLLAIVWTDHLNQAQRWVPNPFPPSGGISTIWCRVFFLLGVGFIPVSVLYQLSYEALTRLDVRTDLAVPVGLVMIAWYGLSEYHRHITVQQLPAE